MIYLLYVILVPISLLLTLVAILLAPVMVLFTVQKEWLAAQPTKEEEIAKLQAQIDALKVQP